MAKNPFDQFDQAANTFDQFDNQPEPAKPASAARKLGDLGLGFASGAVGATKALTDAAGAGNKASQVLGSLNDGINDYLSDEAKSDRQEQGRILADASGKGVWDGVKAGAKAFAVAPVQTAVQGLGSVVPLVAGAALTGGAAPAAAVGAGMGVAMGAGTAKGAIYDEIKKRGGTEEQAIQAQEYGGENTDQIALGGALGVADALTGVSKAASTMARNALGKPIAQTAKAATERGIVSRAGMGMLGEMPLEAAQGGQEQVAANLAAQRAGYEAGTWDNVASNATLEALASAGPGAVFGAMGSPEAKDTSLPPVAPPTPPAPPAQPVGLLGNTPDPLISFADGTVGRRAEVDAYVAGLPENEQPAARARLMGLAPQPATPVAPSAQMGIDPNAGVISKVAAQAVDSGQTDEIERAQANEQDQAAYDQAMDAQEQALADQDSVDKPITSGVIAEAQMSEEDKRAVLFSNQAVADGGQRWTGTQDGDILNGMAAPFATRLAAARRANMEGKDWTIAPVFDGFVARRKDAFNGSSDGVSGAATGSSEQGSDQPAPSVGLGATGGNGVGADAGGRADDALGEPRQSAGGNDDAAVSNVIDLTARLNAKVQDASMEVAVRQELTSQLAELNRLGQQNRVTVGDLARLEEITATNDNGYNASRDLHQLLKGIKTRPSGDIQTETPANVQNTAPAANDTQAGQAATETTAAVEGDAAPAADVPGAGGAKVEPAGVAETPASKFAAKQKQVADAKFSLDIHGWDAGKLAKNYNGEQLNQLYQEVRDQFSNKTIDGSPVDDRGMAVKHFLNDAGTQMHDILLKAMQTVYDRKKAEAAKAKTDAQPVVDTNFTAKQIPDMTDDELRAARAFYPADHKRYPKIAKEISRRAKAAPQPVSQPQEQTSEKAPEAQQSQAQPEAGANTDIPEPAADAGVGGTTEGLSAQFKSYADHIQSDKPIGVGFVEQIKQDERLLDGESENLQAMVQKRREDWTTAARAKADALRANPTAEAVDKPSLRKAQAKRKASKADEAKDREATRADYFTPGNIVNSYGGQDEVLSYSTNDNGGFSVKVHAVRKVGDQWVRQGKPQDARTHSTQPDARELAKGPIARLGYQPASEVQYSEPRADGAKFPNAADRGTVPVSNTQTAGAALANATAPEHVVSDDDRGVSVKELEQIATEFRSHVDAGSDATVTHVFDTPGKSDVVRLNDKVKVYQKDHGWMTLEQAKAKVNEWKAHADSQYKNDKHRSENSQRVVLSLFDKSGAWSQPWEDAGYNVWRFDIQNDPEMGDVNKFSTSFFQDWFSDFEGQDVYAILAACPCTDFAVSGARHFAAKDQDGRTVSSIRLVKQTMATIEYFKPPVWALENPVGRIERLTGLPQWRLSFDPNALGDPYTKKTLLWGRFNGDLPVAPVEPTEGSKMHTQYGGKSQATKDARSVTPEGFAYGFFMANNAIDNPVLAIAGKYDRLDRDLITQAVKAGITESQIDDAVEDFYYQDLDDESANAAIRDLIAEGPNPEKSTWEAAGALSAAQMLEAQAAAKADEPGEYAFVGRNKDGKTIMADHRGVRSITENGVRIEEAVQMRPTRQGMQLSVEHKGEFLTVEEIAKDAKDQEDGMFQGKADKDAILAESRKRNDAKLAESDKKQPAAPADTAQAATETVAKPDAKAALSEREKAAKAKMFNALGKLANLAGKNTRMNWTQEEEQQLLPIVIELFDGAMDLGAVTFQQAVAYVRDFISSNLDAETADAIPFDTLQGAYISVAGRHKDKAVTSKKEVVSFESLAELGTPEPDAVNLDSLEKPADIADTGTEENQNEPTNLGEQDPQTLGGVPAAENSGAKSSGRVGRGGAGRRTRSKPNDSGLAEPGVSGTRSGGSGSTSVRAPAARKPRRGRLGGAGAGTDGSGLPTERSPEPVDLFNQPTEPVSAGNIQAINFRITEDVRLGQGGEAEKFRDNLAAIRTLKAIEAEGRRATSEEQRTLARYVGWGGLASAFPNPETKDWKDDWKARGAELKDLLTQKEYDLARRSTLDSHYTSQTVVTAMWDAARRLGFKGGLAAETSMGIGNFMGLMPESVAGNTRFIGVEYDSLTARMAGLLYPQSTVLHSGLQKVPLSDNAFDLNIGNPPFGDQSLRFQFKPEFNRVSIHNQFFLAGVDSLKPGGLQLNVVSRYLLDAMDRTTRTMLAKKAKLVAAIRLPDTAFKENARTSVVTDIVILQRLTPGEEAEMAAAFDAAAQKPEKNPDKEFERKALAAQVPDWVSVSTMRDPLGGAPMPVNSYFAQNPDMILGTLERSGKMQFKNDITVRPGTAELSELLAKAVAKLPEGIMNRTQEVIDESIARHKTMGDALKIALSGQEAGSIALNPDGVLEQVIERETPEGDYELAKRPLTADAPWSESLFQDAKGNWFTVEAKLDAEGNKLKVMKAGKDGKLEATKANVYERVVYKTEADIPSSKRLGELNLNRLTKLVKLRDLMVAQINLETEDAPTLRMEGNRTKLREAYQAFIAEQGFISKPTNSALVANMPDGALVQALELSYRKAITPDKAKKMGEKPRPEQADPAPILTERVIPKYEPPTSAASPADALSIVLSETGRVDITRMASLLGKTEEEVTAAMFDQADKPLIFKDPESGQWVTRNDYLTGQVKKKLHAAQAAGLDKHIRELEAVLPEAWGAENVTVLLGANFVPPQIYADFVQHMTGRPANVSYSHATNSYAVKGQPATTEKQDEFGAEGITIAEMISDMLNSTAIKVMTKDGDGNTVVDKERTDLAILKSRQIATEFTDWAFADSARRKTLVDLFNEKYNTRVNRQHDGSHLTLPGKVPDAILSMRRHQKNTIWRGISERFMLIDHVVGAGKTFTAIARAMERRRMGLSRKPAIIVPNHMVEQFKADVYRLYPGAKVLAAGKKDFEKSRRRKIFAKVASGDWDIVIIPHSSFGFIGIAPETEERYLEQELATAEQAIKDAWDESDESEGSFRKPFNVKQAERLRDKITARMERLRGDKSKDRLLTFEQMGIDDLTVDEAHEFKNLFYSSKLTGVKGMGNPSGSQKAFDLYTKVRVLRESPTGTVTFMTGTPISNSAVEMFNMMRYLAADELKELGLEHFDAWRAQFVSTDSGWEPNETGRLKEVNRLGRSWSNMRSLMDLYYSFTDSVGNDDIKRAYAEDNAGKQFPIPKVMGGDRQSVVVKPTPEQIAVLEQTIADFDNLPGIEDPYQRNIERLKLMDRARKVSLDVRAAVRGHPSKEAGGKLEKISAEVKRIYDKWTPEKGTQLIFLDRSVPKSKGDDKVLKEYDALVADRNAAIDSDDENALRKVSDKLEKFDSEEMEAMRGAQAGGWNAYQQIKDNLIASGIPAGEIRFIQEATNDAQKQALFDQVKAGEVRVLIGSTPRMGAGTNVQDRLVGLHHADVTWKPSDIEQREGRIIRQGNKIGFDSDGNIIRPDFEVEILAYATERTIDAKMWNLNSAKLKTINAIRNYDGSFSMDFDDDDSVSMAELAALASGNPLLLERVKLDSEINNLELLRKQHQRKTWGFKGRLDDAENAIKNAGPDSERYGKLAEQARQGVDALEKDLEGRSVVVEGKTFSAYGEAAKAVAESIKQQQGADDKAKFSVKIGERRLTSQAGALEALSDALGDSSPFLATANGTTYRGRTALARDIGKLATEAAPNMENKSSKVLISGKMLGFAFEATLNYGRYVGYDIDLALVDSNGRTVYAEETRRQQDEKFVTSAVTGPLGKLSESVNPSTFESNARFATQAAERAKKEVPDLREKAALPFAKEGELKEKQSRLAQVISELSSDKAPESALTASLDVEPDADPAAFSRPKFSIGAQTQANVSVETIAMAIASKWEGSPEIVVAFDMDDPIIPANVRKEDQRQRSGGATGTPEGFYYKGVVYLMSSKLDTPNDVARVLFHEALGHAGLRGAFGGSLKNILRDVVTMRRAEVDAKIKQYGLKGVSKLDRMIAAEEVLAELAQSRPEIGFVKRAIAVIRTWLRQNVPGFNSLRLTDDELIRNYILPARRFVENGGGPKGGLPVRVEPTFSRSMAMYHGSPSNSVREFAADKNGLIFLSKDPEVAGKYAGLIRRSKDFAGHKPTVYKVSVAASKTLDFDKLPPYTGEAWQDALGAALKYPESGGAFNSEDKRATWEDIEEFGGKQLFDAIKAAGFDSVSVSTTGINGRDSEFAVFDADQLDIQSQDEDGAMFSRTLGETLSTAANNAHDVTLPAGYTVGDMLKTAPGKLNWWHKTVGTMYNLAERAPEFKRVFDGVQNFINDVSYYATEAADLAPNILPKLETWKDIGKAPLSPEDTKAISAPIFEGTLTWARDESGKPIPVSDLEAQAASLTPEQKAQRLLRNDKVSAQVLNMWQGLPLDQYEAIINGKYERDMLKAGVVWTDAELRAMFKLTDKQIPLYREFRKATDKSLTNLAISDMLRFGGKDTAPIREQVLAADNAMQAGDMLRDHLMDLADSNPDRKDVLLDTANKMIEKADKAQDLIDRGYAPLSRYGQHTLDVVSAEGERVYFGMFEGKMDAARMARQMLVEYPNATITRGTVSEEEYKLFAGVSPETLELFGDMLGLEAQGDTAASKAFQTYLKLAKSNRSSMKRMIQRKGIAGFSEDSGRVLAGFVYSNARQTASNLHMGEMTDAANEVAKTQGELKDQAVRLVDYVKNPREEAQAFRGLLFAQYIGGSVASAMVNMTQPITMTFPWLSQYTSAADAAKQMTAAMRDSNKKLTGDARLDAALKRAEEDGTVSPQEVHQLMQQSQGRGALISGDGTKAGNALAAANNGLSRFSLGWGKLFSLAEQFNRRSTFIAAYRTAVAQGIEAPEAFARKAIAETQGIYNKGNKPGWARGAVGSTLFTFKQYSIAYVEMLHRMATQGGPEGKKAAMLALAVLFLMSGAGGMPGGDDLDDLISGIMQRLGYNYDSQAKRQEFFASIVGEGGAQFLERGVSGLPGVPIDVSGRLGMGNLIPGTGLLVKKVDHTRDLAEIAGPGGDFVKRGFDAAGKALDGNLLGATGAVATISPKAIQNLYMSYDMANMGMYRDAKGMKVLDTDGYDAAVKAIGFQPNDVKKVQDASFESQRMIGLNKMRETEIANRWAMGIFERDKDKVMAAREELAQWNTTNPESPIRINFKQILQRVQKMNQSKAERIAATAPKEIRADVKRALEVQ